MPAPLPHDDDTPDPRQEDLSRRSGSSPVAIWVVLALIGIGAAVVYVVSAL